MKLTHRSFRIRAAILHIVFLGAAAVIGARLFELQVKEHQQYLARAESQQQHIQTIEPERGEIFLADKNGALHPIAVNKRFPYVYLVPKEIEDPEVVASALAAILDMPKDAIEKRARKSGDPYELVAKRITDEAARKIASLNLKGVYLENERFRFYPLASLAADVIGFARQDDDGRLRGEYGLEAAYDEALRGRAGLINSIRDASGNVFLQFQTSLPEQGASLVLTIDPNVQFRAEEILRRAVTQWHARSGTAIVLEANSGAIRALADWPSFDPNAFSKEKDFRVFMNEAVSSRFEPGSVFKPITMAIALERGAVTPDTRYNDTGEVKIGGYTIRNSDLKAHGTVTMTKVLQESYNTGAVFAAQAVGNDAFREFLAETLSIGEKTGIDLPAEVKGDLSGLFPPNGRPINFATAAFGQGIALTPIKLVEIFGAFANGGTLLQPRIVSSIRYPNGRVLSSAPQIKNSRIIAPETAEALTSMLIQVIEAGTGRRAKIKGYTIAGKTGTAQIPSPGGGYTDETIHTFVAYTPYTDPPFVVLMKLDRPIGVRYAEGSVVPATRELLEFVLQYYGIPPDRPEELQ